MSYTIELLDSAKKARGIESDYRLAQVLGVQRSAVSHYRVGRKCPSNSMVYTLAQMAGMDPDLAVVAVNLERSSSPDEDDVWRSLGARLRASPATAAT